MTDDIDKAVSKVQFQMLHQVSIPLCLL